MTQPESERPNEVPGPPESPDEGQGDTPMVNPILAGEEDYLDLLENLANRRSTRWTSFLVTGSYVLGGLAVAACALALHHWVKH